MNQSQTLEVALAEAERLLAEQNAELDAAFARLENLGSTPIHVDERDLAELASCRPAPMHCVSHPLVNGARC